MRLHMAKLLTLVDDVLGPLISLMFDYIAWNCGSFFSLEDISVALGKNTCKPSSWFHFVISAFG